MKVWKDSLNPRYTKVEVEANPEFFTIDAVMISQVIRIGIDQIAEVEEISIDKIEVDLGMNKITGMIIGEGILEVMWEHIKILEDRIVEEDIEEIIEMKIITEKEVGVGVEKDHFQGIIVIIIEEMTEAQAIADQEWVQTG